MNYRNFIPRSHGLNLLFFTIALFLFFSCDTEPDNKGNLNGTWASAFDSYKIDILTDKIEYTGNYKADIVNSPDYNAEHGVLIIKFTWYYETEYSWDPPYDIISEGETDAYNGKYGAVYWRNLTDASVQMADAYDTVTFTHAMFDDLSAAQSNFTLDKTGDYISVWGSYAK